MPILAHRSSARDGHQGSTPSPVTALPTGLSPDGAVSAPCWDCQEDRGLSYLATRLRVVGLLNKATQSTSLPAGYPTTSTELRPAPWGRTRTWAPSRSTSPGMWEIRPT